MKRHLSVLAFLLIVLPFLAPEPAEARERPFRLRISGTVSEGGAVQATGTASHLGRIVETGTLVFAPDPNDPNRALVTGTVTFTAANGDVLEGVITEGSLDLTTGIGSGTLEITGGTGRFEDASGTVGFTVQQDLVTGEFEIVGLGTIDY